ncbi:MAG: NADPH:quinone reductase [Halodesulfurarchaeum sp.]
MRAIRYHEHGGPEVLRTDEVDRPEPREDEVLVEVEAAGVNPVDTYFREGSYAPGAMPMTPGADLAGEVVAAGPWVGRFAPGDRVFGTGLGRDRQGTYAEYALAPEDNLARLPGGVSSVEGAAVALVGVTAWRALVHHAGLEPAETCLIHGGSGGVGHVAVQLADASGAHVLTTARPEYAERLGRLGADDVFDYRLGDLTDAIVEADRPAVVLDHRLDEYLQFDAAVVEAGARVVGIGNTQPEAGFEDIAAARGKEIQLLLMSMFNTPDFGAVLDRLAALMKDGRIVPDVARTYDLEEAAEAQRAVLDDSFFGKLVVQP